MRDHVIYQIKNGLDYNSQKTIMTYENMVSTFIVNRGAEDEEIAACDSYFDFKMPSDYKYFLKEMNGCILFKVEDIGGFEIFGCDNLIKENKFQKKNLEDEWDESIILICSCLGDGDDIGLKVIDDNSYEIIDCFHEEIPSNWRKIGNSFYDFLQRLLDEKGKKFWLFE